MINIQSEQLLTLSALSKRLPRHRKNRPVHPSTCHRWRNPGVRGIRLECIRIGGIWHTTLEAFQRFCDCLTEAEQLASGYSSHAASNAQTVVNQDRIEEELRARGA